MERTTINDVLYEYMGIKECEQHLVNRFTIRWATWLQWRKRRFRILLTQYKQERQLNNPSKSGR